MTEHWSEKPEEKAELARLTKLLTTPPDLLHNREKSEAHIATPHFYPMPCWLCSCKVNVYFAQQSAFYEEKATYNCIRCGVDMKHAVPFLDTRPWYWSRPKDITPSEVVAACSQWEANPLPEDDS
jgi:hypothetical protein